MRRRQDQHCLNILMRALKESDLTYKEMAEISGFSIFGLVRIIKRLKEQNLVHVSGYYKDVRGADSIKIFSYGKGTDAKKNSLSSAQRTRLYVQRKQLRLLTNSFIKETRT